VHHVDRSGYEPGRGGPGPGSGHGAVFRGPGLRARPPRYPALNAWMDRRRSTRALTARSIWASRCRLGEDGLIVPVVRDAHQLSVEGVRRGDPGSGAASPLGSTQSGRGARRHVHDHQPRVRTARSWRHRSSTSLRSRFSIWRLWSSGRLWSPTAMQRLDRDPADDHLGPSRWDHRALDGALSGRKFLAAVKRHLGDSAALAAGAASSTHCLVDRHADAELWVCHRGGGGSTGAPSSCRRGCRRRARPELIPDVMLLLEHPPVYTPGTPQRGGRAADGRGVVPPPGHGDVIDTDRGGKGEPTHGPGQLVGYPIGAGVEDVVYSGVAQPAGARD